MDSVLGRVGRYREVRAKRLRLTDRLSVVVERFLSDRPLFGRLRQDVFPFPAPPGRAPSRVLRRIQKWGVGSFRRVGDWGDGRLGRGRLEIGVRMAGPWGNLKSEILNTFGWE